MKTILKTYTRGTIATLCGVSYRTVLNWIKHDTIPLSAIKKLGFEIREKECTTQRERNNGV